MALDAFQDIFCRMIASADYRARLIDNPEAEFDQHYLDARDKRRLTAIASHPGMRINTAIHRANRLTPLDQTLPLTCFLLGSRLGALLDRYWHCNPTENLQLPAECARFADFIVGELHSGRLVDPFVGEVLAFERACTELRFFSAEELASRTETQPRLPAKVRVLHFQHDPEPLLEALSELKPPPENLAEGDFHLAVDARSDEAVFRLLDPVAAAALLGSRNAL